MECGPFHGSHQKLRASLPVRFTHYLSPETEAFGLGHGLGSPLGKTATLPTIRSLTEKPFSICSKIVTAPYGWALAARLLLARYDQFGVARSNVSEAMVV